MDIFSGKGKILKAYNETKFYKFTIFFKVTMKPTHMSSLSPPVCDHQEDTPVSVSVIPLERASQIPYFAAWNFAKMRSVGENRGSQNNTDTVWQKRIPQLLTIFNKQERQV